MGQDREKDKIMCRWGNMPTYQLNTMMYLIGYLLLIVGTISVLGVVCLTFPELPVAEMAGQTHWLSIGCIVFGICGMLSYFLFIVSSSYKSSEFSTLAIWILICLGGIQSIWGLRQIYGYAHSNHSLYSLTGSFFIPGPYSG